MKQVLFVILTLACCSLQLSAQNGPNPENDYYQLLEDSQDNILDVVANDDFGMYGPSGSILLIRLPQFGLASVNMASTPTDPTDDYILYSPQANYFGLDTLTYDICDSMNNCRRARAVMEISSVNDLIIAVVDEITIYENDLAVSIDILANDIFPDGYADQSLQVISLPSHGIVRESSQGHFVEKNKISYTTAPNFIGDDMLTYEIFDQDGDSDLAQVIIHILPGAAYHPFPQTEATWHVISTDWDFHPYFYNDKYFMSGDTVVNGHTYDKVYHGNLLLGGFREDSFRRVYFNIMTNDLSATHTHLDPLPLGEYLWHDFNVAIGDTLTLLDSVELYCYELDSVLVDDHMRRRWHFQAADHDVFEFYWIEGIGHGSGPGRIFGDVFETYLEVICYEDDEVFYHAFPDNRDCDFTSTVEIEANELKIFPSIVHRGEIIRIETTGANLLELFIVNQLGQIQVKSISQLSTIRTESLPNGIYYLNMVLENKSVLTSKFIVVE